MGSFKNTVKKGFRKIAEVLSGEIIIKKGWDRHFGFLLYVFVLAVLYITWSLFVETKMAQAKDNEAGIEEMKIEYYQKNLVLTGLNQRTRIENLLKESGNSTLHAPDCPPQTIIIE